MAGRATAVAVAMLLSHAHVSSGFYLPGVAPRAFKDGEPVNIKVQTLVSTETPLQFDYYQLPFCAPKRVRDIPENLGEALTGERAHTSAFQAKMKVTEYCKTLCRKRYTPQEMEEFQDFAILDYRVNMRLDSLPLAEMQTFAYEDKPDEHVETYNLGYPLGGKLETSEAEKDNPSSNTDQFVLNNHLRFKILYHPVDSTDEAHSSRSDDNGNFIIGFQVVPFSIQHHYTGKWDETEVPYVKLATCVQPPNGQFQPHVPQVINSEEGGEVIWTYDVIWERTNIKWASRWDVYLQMTDDKIHWFSIVNSLVILMFLTGIVGLIMTRILRKDFARYNEAVLSAEDKYEANREMREETGWKLISGDVFRPPKFAALLAVFIGSGVQVLGMATFTIVFAVLGFLSPSNRGSILLSMLLLFVLMGLPAGYVSALFCKMFRGAGTDRLRNTLLTAVLFPGAVFGVFFLLNMVLWAVKSTGAIPFGTLLALLCFWFGFSLPLVFLGSYLGFRRPAWEPPVRTNPIPRQIPDQLWYMKSLPSILMGGVLPFGVVFVELFFILSSIWQHRFYYLFGFMALVLVILVVTCAEITIVMCYFQLCSEDYHWWWRSYLTSGASAIYLFLYAGYYLITRIHLAKATVASASIFFGYIVILSYGFFVLTGFAGFISCFFFIRIIYSSIKCD
mmetsp:Transcript_26640/g.60809  ORF Transcript_26640/g.60809 Transcript_26640/m.60809 type:complete len:675 (-) Transcript_26640:2697-4721(-)